MELANLTRRRRPPQVVGRAESHNIFSLASIRAGVIVDRTGSGIDGQESGGICLTKSDQHWSSRCLKRSTICTKPNHPSLASSIGLLEARRSSSPSLENPWRFWVHCGKESLSASLEDGKAVFTSRMTLTSHCRRRSYRHSKKQAVPFIQKLNNRSAFPLNRCGRQRSQRPTGTVFFS